MNVIYFKFCARLFLLFAIVVLSIIFAIPGMCTKQKEFIMGSGGQETSSTYGQAGGSAVVVDAGRPCVSKLGLSNPMSGQMRIADTGSGRVESGLFYPDSRTAVRHNSDGSARAHMGVDYYAEVGTPVYAVTDGVVAFRGSDSKGYGNQALLTGKVAGDERTYTFNYAHLSSVVAEGQVKKGDLIGYTGRTGNARNSTNPHLHFEVREGGYDSRRFANPEDFLNGQVDHRTGMVNGLDCSTEEGGSLPAGTESDRPGYQPYGSYNYDGTTKYGISWKGSGS